MISLKFAHLSIILYSLILCDYSYGNIRPMLTSEPVEANKKDVGITDSTTYIEEVPGTKDQLIIKIKIPKDKKALYDIVSADFDAFKTKLNRAFTNVFMSIETVLTTEKTHYQVSAHATFNEFSKLVTKPNKVHSEDDVRLFSKNVLYAFIFLNSVGSPILQRINRFYFNLLHFPVDQRYVYLLGYLAYRYGCNQDDFKDNGMTNLNGTPVAVNLPLTFATFCTLNGNTSRLSDHAVSFILMALKQKHDTMGSLLNHTWFTSTGKNTYHTMDFGTGKVGQKIKIGKETYELAKLRNIGSDGQIWEIKGNANKLIKIMVHIKKGLSDDVKQTSIDVINAELNAVDLFKGVKFVMDYEGKARIETDEAIIAAVLMPDHGNDLLKELNRNIRFTEDEAVQYFFYLFIAVLQVHAKQVIHRDVKSGNYFAKMNSNKQLEVWIFDFGYMVEMKEKDTVSGVAGTKRYNSPEMGNNEPYSYMTDIYSLGEIYQEIFYHTDFPKGSTKRDKFDAFYRAAKHDNYNARSNHLAIFSNKIFDDLKKTIPEAKLQEWDDQAFNVTQMLAQARERMEKKQ